MKKTFSKILVVGLLAMAAMCFVGCKKMTQDRFVEICKTGKVGLAKKALKKHSDLINGQNEKGYTALIEAAGAGRKNVVELLVSQGADVNASGLYGYTPLMAAVGAKNKDIVELLITNGADIVAADDGGYTAMDFADMDMVKPLVENGFGGEGADVKEREFKNACEKGNIGVVARGLRNHQDYVKLRINKGWEEYSVLHSAVYGNYTTIAKMLIAYGANVRDSSEIMGDSADIFYDVVLKGNIDIIEMFIANGANVNSSRFTMGFGSTSVLESAVQEKRRDIVDLLLASGEDLDFDRALIAAAGIGSKSMVDIFIQKGADVNFVKYIDGGILTALSEAARGGHKNMVEYLISKGANLNLGCEPDQFGYTHGNVALRAAMYERRKDIVELLVAKGATDNEEDVANFLKNNNGSNKDVEVVDDEEDKNDKKGSSQKLIYFATSYLAEMDTGRWIEYTYENLRKPDGYPWTSKNGKGIGDNIKITSDKKLCGSFYIINGYISKKQPALYEKNSRLKSVEVRNVANGRAMEVSIEDSKEMQQIDCTRLGEGEKFCFTILSVYPGEAYKDLCIQYLAPKEAKK